MIRVAFKYLGIRWGTYYLLRYARIRAAAWYLRKVV